ncbi:MAG: M1 family metallopeptidase [Flavobacteriaceae bacterium]|nr:M1 family metallopeptidase [Flavobacteriaceae bacterium]
MKSKLLPFLLLSFILFSGYSQTVNKNRPSYWQQKVDYKMEIDMNVKTYQYTGKTKLVYTNNSPDVLNKVYFHLYNNAFQPNSEMDIRSRTIEDPDRRVRDRIFNLKPDEIGYTNIKSLKQNGVDVHYKVQGTILEVTLNTLINPSTETVFDMEFEAQVPVQIRRSGRNNREGIALSMAQWYPKMAEYDEEGWHTDPYIAREFYGVWGDFDVTINIDKKYTLGGTGYLQNPQEIGHGYEDKTKPLLSPKGNTLKWHFKAPNVHDFTWAADTDYLHDILKTNNGTTMHFLYKNKSDIKENWKLMQPYAVKTMEYLNKTVGEYPYQQYSVIQGGDGGMEYGMCTLISGGGSLDGLIGVTIHEMAHSWFQFVLANNELKYSWMDEGFTSFIEVLTSHNIYKPIDHFLFENEYDTYFKLVDIGKEEPLSTHADHFNINRAFTIASYYKGLIFLSQLGYVIGEDNLMKTLQVYYDEWKFQHPNPNDFKRIAEKVSGIQLDWYLQEWIQTTNTIDYAVVEVNNNEISLERIGKMPMPIDLKVVYDDQSVEYFYIPLSSMRGEKPTTATLLPDWTWAHPTYTFKTLKKIKSIEIDESLLMADINRNNNVYQQN